MSGLSQRRDRDVRPNQSAEVQQHGLSILQLLHIFAAGPLHGLDPENRADQRALRVRPAERTALQERRVGNAALDCDRIEPRNEVVR
jgi:hypothetical protein